MMLRLFAEVAGVHVHGGFKVAAEGEQVGKAALLGDAFQGQVGGLEQVDGLLDLAAQLLESEQMDETGALEESNEIVVAPASEGEDGKPVILLQKDIRQLQLAKSAIASGVHLLAKKMGIEVDEISQVWLAGAFGSFMSPESACRIGLIPEELEGRVSAIGNAAGEGAKLALRDRRRWELAGKLAREADFLELATMREFQDMFVDELLFPERS